MSKELAVQEVAIQEAKRRYNLIVEFTKSMMVEGKDYGVIPGTDKPTLLKPGAEKLTTLFELVPDFIILDKILDFDRGLFYFQYRCNLTHKNELVASGIGSCNSKEKKYRYRYIPEWKASDEEKAAAIRKETKTSKGGRSYVMLTIENTEPFELVNTIDKMAQKRALIAATLIAANASEFFTQDIEDLQVIEGTFVEDIPDEKRETKPEPEPVKPAESAVSSRDPAPAKQNGKPRHFAPQDFVDAGISPDIADAAGVAMKLKLSSKNTTEDAVRLGKAYRAERDGGLSPDEAAAKVLAGKE